MESLNSVNFHFHFYVDGVIGLPGKDGINGIPGKDGKNGINGLPGKDAPLRNIRQCAWKSLNIRGGYDGTDIGLIKVNDYYDEKRLIRINFGKKNALIFLNGFLQHFTFSFQ